MTGINSKKSNTTPFYLLLVDDDPLIAPSMKLLLPPHWKLVYSSCISDVNYTFPYNAAFVDMHLQDDLSEATGLNVIKKLKNANPTLDVIAISGDLSLNLMERGLEAGAHRFLGKPLIPDEFLLYLSKIEALIQIREAAQNSSVQGPRWIGASSTSEKIRLNIAALRGEPGPILIIGESGCGKEITSQLLHQQEGRGPLISVNMGGITETLFESEFFGHIKGAFTGADNNKVGLIEAASGGDLFLDEIEALPLSLQAKLLRFLETGEYKKVGSKESQIASCRVICASNCDLAEMVKQGKFRDDLYWRISGKKIFLNPLRERAEDIPDLVDFFLSNDRPKRNKKFSADGIEALKVYTWPGNVRELKRVCEQLSLTSPLPIIRGTDVQKILCYTYGNNSTNKSESDPVQLNDLINLPSMSLNELMSQYEALVIQKKLNSLSGDIDKAAEELQVSRSNLYKKIKDYKIEIK